MSDNLDGLNKLKRQPSQPNTSAGPVVAVTFPSLFFPERGGLPLKDVFRAGYAQSQAYIITRVFAVAQSQADIKATSNAFAQAQADIKAISRQFSQAQADIKTTYTSFGQSQADIKATSNKFGQAQGTILAKSVAHAQAQARIYLPQYAIIIPDLENEGWIGVVL